MFQITRRFESKSYKKTINQQMLDIQNNKECLSSSRETTDGQKYKMTSKYVQGCQKYQ